MSLYGAAKSSGGTNSSSYPSGKNDGTCNEKLPASAGGLDGTHGRSVNLGSGPVTNKILDTKGLDGQHGRTIGKFESDFKEGAGVPSRGASPEGVITDMKTTGRMYVGKSWA